MTLKDMGVLSPDLEQSWGQEFVKFQKNNLFSKAQQREAEAALMQEVEPTLPSLGLKIREKMRHCFVYFGNAHGSSRVKRQQARNVVRDYLKLTAECWGRVQRFNRYINTVEHIRCRLRRTMSARHAQRELLHEFFEKERKAVVNYLKMNKKSMKDRDFADALARKMTDISPLSVQETLSEYMAACRV